MSIYMGFNMRENEMTMYYGDEKISTDTWYVFEDIASEDVYFPIGEDKSTVSISNKLQAEQFCRYLFGVDEPPKGVVGYRRLYKGI